MAVKVIIDRNVKEGKESEFSELLKQLRTKALSAKGYISGETLRALSDHHEYIVIGTWQSIDDWNSWEKNAARQKIQASIDEIVTRPTRTTIYVHA